MRALVGFTYGASDPAWETSARRLIDILMDGLRARPPIPPPSGEGDHEVVEGPRGGR